MACKVCNHNYTMTINNLNISCLISKNCFLDKLCLKINTLNFLLYSFQCIFGKCVEKNIGIELDFKLQ